MLYAWCSVEDLSCQYYLREESVGKPRAQACVARLQELNPHVQVRDSSPLVVVINLSMRSIHFLE